MMAIEECPRISLTTFGCSPGNKRQTVEIQVTHVGPDLQFQSASVGPAAATSAEEAEREEPHD